MGISAKYLICLYQILESKMGAKKLVRGVWFFTLAMSSVICFVLCSCGANAGRRKTFKELLGSYVLDLDKTKLEGSYIKDSSIYGTNTRFVESSFFTIFHLKNIDKLKTTLGLFIHNIAVMY